MRESSDTPEAAPPASSCPLPWPEQRRNLIVFMLCTGMQYLAAPLLYVGITQGALGERLNVDARSANLPQTLFFSMMAVPAIIAWASPGVAALKRNLSLCYFVVGLMQAAVSLILLTDAPNSWKLAVVILQGGTAGALISTAIALLWEVVARGTDESRRGLALGLAFGVGPLFAVLGSFIQMNLLGDGYWGIKGLEYPDNFAWLFGLGAPVMWTAAIIAQFSIVPPATYEQKREPVKNVLGLLIGVPAMFVAVYLLQSASAAEKEASTQAVQGLAAPGALLRLAGYAMTILAAVAVITHFRSILRSRVLLTITVVTILLYAGNGITTNMGNYSKIALGSLPEKYAGLQNMQRFAFKMVAGLLLGWLLTRSNPRTGLLGTAALLLMSQIWAINVTGPAYLLAFGIYGAGELVGVYCPNYLVSASRPEEIRRNMAYATLLMVPAAPASYLYGGIVDAMDKTPAGYRLSFWACAGVILAGILIAVFLLPARPKPEEKPAAEQQSV